MCHSGNTRPKGMANAPSYKALKAPQDGLPLYGHFTFIWGFTPEPPKFPRCGGFIDKLIKNFKLSGIFSPKI